MRFQTESESIFPMRTYGIQVHCIVGFHEVVCCMHFSKCICMHTTYCENSVVCFCENNLSTQKRTKLQHLAFNLVILKIYTFCQLTRTVNDVPNQNTRFISFPFEGIYDAIVEPLQTFAV